MTRQPYHHLKTHMKKDGQTVCHTRTHLSFQSSISVTDQWEKVTCQMCKRKEPKTLVVSNTNNSVHKKEQLPLPKGKVHVKVEGV